MMIKKLLLILIFAHCITSFAQTFTGTIKGKGEGVLTGATVVASSAEGSIVAYSITNDKGAFRLVVPEGKTPVNVNVSYMGYQKKTIPFSQMKSGMTITLVEGGFNIKEVKVKAQRIHSIGDTLTYSVAGFRQGQDRSIADVIAKMPGLEVKTNGQIEYQGIPINKFYIEGLDLMGSKYGVANKNISADKVRSVQVLENHQPVKSLRGVSFNESAALNLVLQDDAKAVWSGTADIGLGYGEDFLYDSRLMGMRFNKKFQTLMMYKNNDTGTQLYNEVFDYTTNRRNFKIQDPDILSLIYVGEPDLDEDRYTFNNSHLLAGNWLWKTGVESELRLQGNGYIDRTDMCDYNSTTYLTLADLPVITEEQDVTNTRSEWKGEANYQYNGAKTFVKNNIRGYIDMNKSVGTMSCNEDIINMSVKPRKRSLINDFQLSHTTGRGNVYSFSSYCAYNYLPGQLLTINGMTEHLNLGFFSTQNEMKHKLKIGRHYVNNVIGINYDYQNIEVAMDEDTEQNNVYQLLCGYWEPSVSFVFGRHKVDLKSKLSYAHQFYRTSGGKSALDRLQSKSHLWVAPSFSWRWDASVVSVFSADVSYSLSPLTGKAIYDTPIFTSYRTQHVNRGEIDVMKNIGASATYKYSNPMHGLFFNVTPIYNRVCGNILYQSSLINKIYTVTATDKEYATQTFLLTGRVSKAFGWAKTFIGLSATHSISDYCILVSDEINNARMGATTAAFDFSLRPVKMLSIEGKSNVEVYKQQNLTNKTLSAGSTIDWQHNINFYFFPAERWMISLKNEFYHANDESVGTNYFLDFALSYKTKHWELSFNARNVIGTSDFERRTLGNTIESYNVTRLRPRELLVKWSVDL